MTRAGRGSAWLRVGGIASNDDGLRCWGWLAVIAAAVSLSAGCSADDPIRRSVDPSHRSRTASEGVTTTAAAVATAERDAAVAATEPVVLRPGEGVAVRAAGGLRPGSDFVGEVYRQLLGELGYSVSEPRDLVVPGSSVAYLYLAEGEFDVWLDGRYPYDGVWLDGQRFDGSRVGDHVVVLGQGHAVDAWMGWLISKSFADEYGVYTFDALNDDPAAVAAFDASDAVPGNGRADVLTVPEGSLISDVQAAQAAFSRWDRIALVPMASEEYFALDQRFEDAVARSEPMIAVASTPSRTLARVRPGRDVYWLGIEDILDDSNPLGHREGHLFSQWTRGFDSAGGHAPVGVEECPSAAHHPDSLCSVGWATSVRTVAARTEFAEVHPAAAALLDAVHVPGFDVSEGTLRLAEGAAAADLATDWIAANRVLADGWLAEARAVAARS